MSQYYKPEGDMVEIFDYICQTIDSNERHYPSHWFKLKPLIGYVLPDPEGGTVTCAAAGVMAEPLEDGGLEPTYCFVSLEDEGRVFHIGHDEMDSVIQLEGIPVRFKEKLERDARETYETFTKMWAVCDSILANCTTDFTREELYDSLVQQLIVAIEEMVGEHNLGQQELVEMLDHCAQVPHATLTILTSTDHYARAVAWAELGKTVARALNDEINAVLNGTPDDDDTTSFSGKARVEELGVYSGLEAVGPSGAQPLFQGVMKCINVATHKAARLGAKSYDDFMSMLSVNEATQPKEVQALLPSIVDNMNQLLDGGAVIVNDRDSGADEVIRLVLFGISDMPQGQQLKLLTKMASGDLMEAFATIADQQ